jgi:tetratricopeptide (TPR) repeat protein
MGNPVNPRAMRLARRIVGTMAFCAMRLKLEYRRLLNGKLILNILAICSFLFVVSPQLLSGQQSGSSGGATPGWPLHDSAPTHGLPDAMGTTPQKTPEKDDSCMLWTVAGAPANAVSTATLQIPGKARGEYDKGCSDLRNKKLESAENHLRKAVEVYPRYAGALVLLGQVLAANNRIEEARGLCSQASGVDADFVPAYLCLADVSGQLRQWNQALDFADHALKLDPVQNLYGHFYMAVAQFHLSQLAGAEKNALQTIDADHRHRLPQAHLLLAQIYGTRRDLKSAATQLRVYLQVAPKAPDAGGVRKSLEDLERQIAN